MLAKILIALGAVIASAALMIGLTNCSPTEPQGHRKMQSVCADKPDSKSKSKPKPKPNPHSEFRCDR